MAINQGSVIGSAASLATGIPGLGLIGGALGGSPKSYLDKQGEIFFVDPTQYYRADKGAYFDMTGSVAVDPSGGYRQGDKGSWSDATGSGSGHPALQFAEDYDALSPELQAEVDRWQQSYDEGVQQNPIDLYNTEGGFFSPGTPSGGGYSGGASYNNGGDSGSNNVAKNSGGRNEASGIASNWAPRYIPEPSQAYQTGIPDYLQMPQMRPPLQTQQSGFPQHDQGQWQQTLEGIYQRVLQSILGSSGSPAGSWYERLLG